jgi:hypothetical protein
MPVGDSLLRSRSAYGATNFSNTPGGLKSGLAFKAAGVSDV